MSPLLNTTFLAVGLALMVGAYIPYVRGILAGRTKPHQFTWIIWTILTAIAAGVQFQAGSAATASITALSTFGCILVSVLAARNGDRHAVAADYVSLSAALAAIVWWRLADDPLKAIFFVILADLFGFFPTIRKSFVHPHEENISIYALNSLRYAIGVALIRTWTTEAWLFPAYVAVSQGGFALLLLALRRRR